MKKKLNTAENFETWAHAGVRIKFSPAQEACAMDFLPPEKKNLETP